MGRAESRLRDSSADFADPEELGFSAERLQRITTVYEGHVARGDLAGAVIAIVRERRTVYLKAIGYQDYENRVPMQTDSIFRIMSMTKPFTSIAAMMLSEEGQLNIAAPVAQYLREFEGARVGVEKINPTTGKPELSLEEQKRPMTVQDLLRHTSGLVYSVLGDSLVHRAYGAANLLPVGERGTTLAETINDIARIPLAHQPGEFFEYGHSTDVLGRIVEVVAGMPLDRFIEERICVPLGLESTAFALPQTKRELLAKPRPPRVGDPPGMALPDPSTRPKMVWGGTGLLSTAPDYLRLCSMLLNGGLLDGVRLLAPKTVELMTSDALPPGIGFPVGPFWKLNSIPSPAMGLGFGLGFAVRTAPGLNPLPGSIGSYFWLGGMGTAFLVDPAEKLIAVQMTQVPTLDEVNLYRDLFVPLVYQAMTGKL